MTRDNEITVLLIEDNPGDARLIREILAEETSADSSSSTPTGSMTGLERLAQGASTWSCSTSRSPTARASTRSMQTHTRIARSADRRAHRAR